MEISVNLATMPASAAVATNVVTRDGFNEHIQLMNIADPITANTASVAASGSFPTLSASNAVATYQQPTTGQWAYYSGTAGTVTLTSSQRILSIAAHSTSGGSFAINGGSAIPIIAATSYYVQPLGNLIGATIVFTSTDSYMVEILT